MKIKLITHDSHKNLTMNVFPNFKCFIENAPKSLNYDNGKPSL